LVVVLFAALRALASALLALPRRFLVPRMSVLVLRKILFLVFIVF
jgi:hypothetical protein